jgi:hypothetical protein
MLVCQMSVRNTAAEQLVVPFVWWGCIAYMLTPWVTWSTPQQHQVLLTVTTNQLCLEAKLGT